ncbi:unnamed protein product [Brassicogethes aeneus]|nr:unnamed protein product [Brassicogethes aeneus]
MFFNLLNNVFDVLKTCQNEPDIENLLIKFFQTVKLSYSELTFGINLYDAALVNISVCILILKCSNLENILLANVLQTNIWCNMLAVDIWCIILSNSESSLVLQTLLDLISIQQLSDFGIFTKRIENSNLDNLVKRIYKLLPVDCNKHIALQYPPNENITLWNILGYQNLSILEKNIILQNLPDKAFCKNNLNKLENFQHFYLSLQYLEANNLITNGGLNIYWLNDLWSFHKPPENILNNNIFKMYFTVLGKITLNNIKKLPKPLIMTILDQLLLLGCENEFKSLITDIIHELCLSYQEEFGPDQYKLYRILGGLIYPVLLKNCDVTKKIKIYDLIGKLNDSPAYKNVVKTVFQNAVDLQNEMGNFIKENFQLCLDPNYIQSIEKVSIDHSCTLWRRDAFNKGIKSKLSHSLQQTEFKEKIKSDDKTSKLNFKPTENLEFPPAKKCKMDEETPSDVTEALSSIKTEIKSLMKILKTDKMSPKNASQLKIIISQLQSLL